MSENRQEYIVRREDNAKANDIVIGKYWVAINKGVVIQAIQKRVPNGVDFDSYTEKAKELLGMIGDVKSGEIVIREGERVFIKRLNHANRNKNTDKPRVPEEFAVKC